MTAELGNQKALLQDQSPVQAPSWQQVQPHAPDRTPDELERGVKDHCMQNGGHAEQETSPMQQSAGDAAAERGMHHRRQPGADDLDCPKLPGADVDCSKLPEAAQLGCPVFEEFWAWYLALLLPSTSVWLNKPGMCALTNSRLLLPLPYVILLSTNAAAFPCRSKKGKECIGPPLPPPPGYCAQYLPSRAAILRVMQAVMVSLMALDFSFGCAAIFGQPGAFDPMAVFRLTDELFVFAIVKFLGSWVIATAVGVWMYRNVAAACSGSPKRAAAASNQAILTSGMLRAIIYRIRSRLFAAALTFSSVVDFCAVSGIILTIANISDKIPWDYSVGQFAYIFMMLWLQLSLAWMPQTVARFGWPLGRSGLADVARLGTQQPPPVTAQSDAPEAIPVRVQSALQRLIWTWVRGYAFWTACNSAFMGVFGFPNCFADIPDAWASPVVNLGLVFVWFWLLPGPGLRAVLHRLWAWQLLQKLKRKEIKKPPDEDSPDLEWLRQLSAEDWLRDLQLFIETNLRKAKRTEMMYYITELVRVILILSGLEAASQLSPAVLAANESLFQVRAIVVLLPQLASLVMKPMREKWKLPETTVLHSSYAEALRLLIEAELLHRPFDVPAATSFSWRFYFGRYKIGALSEAQLAVCKGLFVEDCPARKREIFLWKTYEVMKVGTDYGDNISQSTAYLR